MDMIFNSADNLGHAVHASDDPTEVRVKTWLPFGLNERWSCFGREDDVIGIKNGVRLAICAILERHIQ
jgi:hypothetical protein